MRKITKEPTPIHSAEGTEKRAQEWREAPPAGEIA
jgi:hypothetical protein